MMLQRLSVISNALRKVACFSSAVNPIRLSMKEEYPGTPKLKPASDLKPPETLSTVLPSGLTVVTRETYEAVSSIGIFVGSGSVDEEDNEYGCAYMMEKMAFKSTEKSSRKAVVKRLEDIGANVITKSSRDSIMLIIDTLRGNVEKCVNIFSEAIVSPCLLDEEIQESSNILEYENEDCMMTRDYAPMSVDYIHAAMYGPKSPYGHPLRYCNPLLNHDILYGFWKKHFTPKNIKIVGIGVEHDSFVEFVQKSFQFPSKPTIETPKAKIPSRSNNIVLGGAYHTEVEGMDATQVNIGFHCDGWESKDLVPICLLQTLLGGGKMFSAGGPGKGMFSRLYADVMNRYGWFESCNIQMMMCRNQGMMTLQCLVPLSYISPTTKILCDHVRRLIAEPVSDEEFERSKNQFKSMLYMNLEQRSIYCEEIGQQFLSYGYHKTPDIWAKEIDDIKKEDIMKAVKKMLDYPICYSIFGKDVKKEASSFPPLEGVRSYLMMPYK